MDGKGKQAAFEEVMDRPLSEISAADLLDLMQERDDVAMTIQVLPEKKKVELEVEPIYPKITLTELLKKLRNEKKKAEYEVEPGVFDRPRPDWQKLVTIPEWKKYAREVPDDYLGVEVIDPRVIDALTTQLEERLEARFRARGLMR